MDNQVGRNNNLKRKLSASDRISGISNAKRTFRCTEETPSKTMTRSSETDLLKDRNGAFITPRNSVNSRLKQTPVNNRHHRLSGIANQNSQKQWFPIDSPHKINSLSNFTSQKHSVLSATTSVGIAPGTGKTYSASARLQSLRNKIANTATNREWVTSNLPQATHSSESVFQNCLTLPDLYKVDKPVLNKRNFVQRQKTTGEQCSNNSSVIPTLFRPFEPLANCCSKPTCLSVCENVTATEYDDSDSAAEFGKDDNVSHQNNGSRFGNVSHINYLKQKVGTQAGPKSTNRFKPNKYQQRLASNNIGTSQDFSIHSNNKSQKSMKLHQIEEEIKCSAKTKPSGFVVKESNPTELHKFNNAQAMPEGYSANDRLINIQSKIFLNNCPLKTLTNCSRKPTENIKISKLPERTHTVSSISNNSGNHQSDNVISTLGYHNNVVAESQVNRPSLLGQRLLNIKNSGSRKTVTNLDKSSLPVSDRLQVNETISVNKINSENQSFNYLLTRNEHIIPETQLHWRSNSESMPLTFRNVWSDSESCTDEPMDWSNIDESETLSSLQVLRKTIVEAEEITRIPQTPFQEIVAKSSPEMPHNMTFLKEIYVVVDTNIFISHLRIVKQVLDIKINGVETPIIMIPWMVIQELDYIKDGRSGKTLMSKAQEAIRFINHKLTHKDQLVKGQSVMDAAAQEFSSNNPDDGILHCCLQIIKKRNKATLLSNDVNLRNKALLHNVPAYGHDGIIDALHPYKSRYDDNFIHNVPKEDGRIKELKLYLSDACSNIISEVLQQDYGAMWEQMKPKNSPWSLQKCIELFKKYWSPVFSMHLNKHCAKLVDEFEAYLKTKSDGIIPIEDGEKLIEFGLSLCVFLKNGLPRFKAVVALCINNIQNVVL